MLGEAIVLVRREALLVAELAHSAHHRQHIPAYGGIIMEAMREQWTDARLDDLNDRVSYGFNRIDADLRAIRGEIGSLRPGTTTEFGSLRTEMKTEFGSLRSEMKTEFASLRAETNARFDALNDRFDALNARFDALQRAMLVVSGSLIAALLVAVVSVLVGLV